MDTSQARKTGEIDEDEQSVGAIDEPTQLEDAVAPRNDKSEPEVKAKTGRAKRRERRLRHEPLNVTGEQQSMIVYNMHVHV